MSYCCICSACRRVFEDENKRAVACPLCRQPAAPSPPEGNGVPPLTELSPVADVGVIVENRASGARWQWTGKVWAKLPAGAPQWDPARSTDSTPAPIEGALPEGPQG